MSRSNLLHDSDGGEMLSAKVRQIPLERIQPDPQQPRHQIDTTGPQWEGLVASVREHGVLQPILVCRHPEQAGAYQIICGERRWRAAREVGLGHITARIIEVPAMLTRKSEYQLLENALREELSPLDEMEACVRLLNNTGMEKQELAGLLGVSPPVVSDIVKLDQIHPEVRARIRASGTSIPRRQLLRIAGLADLDAQTALLSDILTHGKAPTTSGPPATRMLVGRDYRCSLRFGEPLGSEQIRLTIRGGRHPERVAKVLRQLADELAPSESTNHAA